VVTIRSQKDAYFRRPRPPLELNARCGQLTPESSLYVIVGCHESYFDLCFLKNFRPCFREDLEGSIAEIHQLQILYVENQAVMRGFSNRPAKNICIFFDRLLLLYWKGEFLTTTVLVVEDRVLSHQEALIANTCNVPASNRP